MSEKARKDYKRKWYEKNKARILRKRRTHYKANRKAKIRYQHEYYEKNKSTINKKQKKYNDKHKRKQLKYLREYRRKHKKILQKKMTRFVRQLIKTDPQFKLVRNLRSRLGHAIKNNLKSGSAVKDLGCSIAFFKQYIEKQFYGKMTWENWGTYWQLDHIQELADFDLTDRKQLLEACHYTNLRPLTISDHQKKTIKARKARHKSVR